MRNVGDILYVICIQYSDSKKKESRRGSGSKDRESSKERDKEKNKERDRSRDGEKEDDKDKRKQVTIIQIYPKIGQEMLVEFLLPQPPLLKSSSPQSLYGVLCCALPFSLA